MNKTLEINGRKIGKGVKPFVLAEVACSHDGDIEKVKEMISFTSEAGADGIQFQMFSTDNLLVPTHQFYDVVKGLEISLNDWKALISYAKNKGLTVFANILEASAFPAAMEAGVHALKIHSADMSNPEMLRQIASSSLPVVLSTGGSTVEEVEKAVGELKNNGVEDLLLMHGFQAYPTELEDSHLDYIETLSAIHNLPVGYQDHVDGGEAMAKVIPLLAMAKGAVLIEKHITDDRERKGTDYQSSLGCSEFFDFVNLVNDSWATFGESKVRELSEAEIKYRKNFKKSIVAARDISEGEEIKESMILFMRGEPGIPPTELTEVLGKKSSRGLKKFESIKYEGLI